MIGLTRNSNVIKKLLNITAAAGLVFLTTTPALAREGESTDDSTVREKVQQVREKSQEKREERAAQREDKKLEIQEKLADRRLQQCEAKQERINGIVDKHISRSTDALSKMNAARDKLVAYYADQGITLDNYDALMGALTDAEANVQENLDVADVDFYCSEEGVNREFGQSIKTNLEALHASLKAYKSALKDFARAIRDQMPDDETDADQEDDNETTDSTEVQQ